MCLRPLGYGVCSNDISRSGIMRRVGLTLGCNKPPKNAVRQKGPKQNAVRNAFFRLKTDRPRRARDVITEDLVPCSGPLFFKKKRTFWRHRSDFLKKQTWVPRWVRLGRRRFSRFSHIHAFDQAAPNATFSPITPQNIRISP